MQRRWSCFLMAASVTLRFGRQTYRGRSKHAYSVLHDVKRCEKPQVSATSSTASANRPRIGVVLVALLAVGTIGCASHASRVRSAREFFYSGDVDRAAQVLEKQQRRSDSDQDVIALDLAMANLFSGHPDQAEQRLRVVRDRFDEFEQTDLRETALSYVADDNRRAYAGEDYEKILIRIILAFANLMQDGLDAEAYSLQVNAKQQQIIQVATKQGQTNPKASYNQVAVGAYLHGVLSEATHLDYGDAERSFLKVVSWEPQFKEAEQDLQRVRTGHHSAPGNGVLYVFAFVGRGPYKREVSEIPTSQALLIADRILSNVGKHSLPPTLAPIKVPQLVAAANEIDSVLVAVEAQNRGRTETITDVSRLAMRQYEAAYPRILGRAVARRALKKAAIYAAKDHTDSENDLINFAMDAAGVLWEAAESADTRCWGLLPETIQVLRVELPAGQHTMSLRPMRAQTAIGHPVDVAVKIEDGRNTYALAFFPGPEPAGQVLVSHQ